MKEHELNPQERALKMEGDALLARAMATPGSPVTPAASGLLKSDGSPMEDAPKPAPTREQVVAHAAEIENQKKIYDGHVAAVSKRLGELIAKDSNLLDLASLVLLAHRIIAFAKMEMAFRPGMTDELIDYMERFQHNKANDPAGFDTRSLEKSIKHQLLPILQTLTKKYELLGQLRASKLKAARTKLPTGFSVPPAIREKFPKNFHIGDMFIVHGPEVAVQEAMRYFSAMASDADKVGSYRLSSLAATTDFVNQTLMPGAWWRGAADDLAKLEDILKPVFESTAPLAIVDELIQLVSPTGSDTPLERKAIAVRSLKQWSVENMCAMIAGDVLDDDVPDTRVYGVIPHFAVKLDSVEGKRVLLIEKQSIVLE